MTSPPTPDGDPSSSQGGGSWHAEAAAADGRLTFLFDREPSRDVVVTVAAEPGAAFTVPEIRRLHAALGNVLTQLE